MPKPVSFPFPIRDPLPINSAFGRRPLYGDLHTGVDFNSTTGVVRDKPIPAAGDGVVVESYNGNSPGQTNWAQQRGTMVVIDHGDGWKTRYHMLVPDSNIPKGTRVKAGDIIGKVGSSGKSTTGPHLHFELWKDGVAINPVGQLTYNAAALAGVTSNPFDNEYEDEMIRIKAPNRDYALIGPGYYRPLATQEEVQQSGSIMSKHVDGNDRQYDIWVSLAVAGAAAVSNDSVTDKAILANVKTIAAKAAVEIDYDKLADLITAKLPATNLTKADVLDALTSVSFKAAE